MLFTILFAAVAFAILVSSMIGIRSRMQDAKQVEALEFLTNQIYEDYTDVALKASEEPYPNTWTEHHDQYLSQTGLSAERCEQVVLAWKAQMHIKEMKRKLDLKANPTSPSAFAEALKVSSVNISAPKQQAKPVIYYPKKVKPAPEAEPANVPQPSTPKPLELD